MKEYIERTEAINAIRQYQYPYGVEFLLANIPAADVVEVRHGYWKPYEAFPMAPSLNGYPCSECGMHFSPSAIPILKYCPNCGARMDKEADHEVS